MRALGLDAPAGTISVEAPALWLLPSEVERIAKRRNKLTVEIVFYVGGKRARVLKVLLRFELDAKLADIADWAVAVVMKA